MKTDSRKFYDKNIEVSGYQTKFEFADSYALYKFNGLIDWIYENKWIEDGDEVVDVTGLICKINELI